MDGGRYMVDLPKRQVPGRRVGGQNSPSAISPGSLLYAASEGTHMHVYMHTLSIHTQTHSPTHTHTHTNPAGLKWARHFDIDLFFLSHRPPIPFFHLLCRIPCLTPRWHITERSSRLQLRRREEGGRGEGQNGGGILGKMGRGEEGWE